MTTLKNVLEITVTDFQNLSGISEKTGKDWSIRVLYALNKRNTYAIRVGEELDQIAESLRAKLEDDEFPKILVKFEGMTVQKNQNGSVTPLMLAKIVEFDGKQLNAVEQKDVKKDAQKSNAQGNVAQPAL